MRKLNPLKAQDNPLAAAVLGSILVKAGLEGNDPDQQEAGQRLLKIAQDNQDKMPRLDPKSKLEQAIKENKAKASPQP